MAKFKQFGELGWNDLEFSCFSSSPVRCFKYLNIVLPCVIEIFVFLWALADFFLGGGGLTSLLSLSLAVAANTGVLEEVKLVSAFLILNMGNRGHGFTFDLFKFSLLLVSLTLWLSMGFPKHSLLSSSWWSSDSDGGTTLGLFMATPWMSPGIVPVWVLFREEWEGNLEIRDHSNITSSRGATL